ncbi:uncharacterized protein LOC111233397 [Seriola dumerili]|uniref:Uncharacterized LOC111233397 n=1 Tax=Seriola dumerili TaxID=41447 RepID=A0A3B4UCU4_SERDU|nr:uncharacterized protein LOC111233397 [Seriola dumerili]
MHDSLLSVISCLCILLTGLHAEECSHGVLAKRDIFYVAEGGSQSLSCVVQHCGVNWTGNWTWKNSTDKTFSTIKDSDRHYLTNEELSANETRLVLNLLRVSHLDEGSYRCKVVWDQGNTDMGHLTYVNITAAVPSQRKSLHRVLVCAGALLCLPLIMGLARCLSSEDKPQPFSRSQSTHAAVYRQQPYPAPQPPPRCRVPQKRSTSSQKASPMSPQKTEVVYADISKDALKQPVATREPAQSTVYAFVKFS